MTDKRQNMPGLLLSLVSYASINFSGAHAPPGQPRGICSNVSPGGGALAILSQPGGWALALVIDSTKC